MAVNMRIAMLSLFCVVMFSISQRLAAQQQPLTYPLVLRADAPLYPPLALTAKITGQIAAELTVKNGEVIAVKAGGGHPLLVKATTENIRSWHFVPEANGTFTATFVYELRGDETAVIQNAKVEMQLPTFVKITASPTKPSCNDCEPGAEIVGKPVHR
jgi:hypothetical protein